MVRSVGIIGAGPGGLACARAFLSNTSFEVTIFEKADHVGGIWYYHNGDRRSAMYDNLESNIIKQLMAFSGFPFPDYDSTFPSRQRVWEYLRLYFLTYIKGQARVFLRSHVVSLEKHNDTNTWQLRLDNGNVFGFDFVVIANGNYNVENIPNDIPGLAGWKSMNQAASVHSKWFTNSEYARGKTIVVVGNGASGIDIANQLATVANRVYHSVRDITMTSWPSDSIIEAVGAITEINAESRTISFDTGDIIHNVDQIIWATGYRYSVPFLKSYREYLFQSDKIKGVDKIYNLWENLIFTRDPSLAFLTLCKGVVAFPVAEMHASLIAQVFDGRVSRLEMSYCRGKPLDFNFEAPGDVDYYKHLQELIEAHITPADNFLPVKWDKRMRKLMQFSRELHILRSKELVNRSCDLRKIGLSYTLN